MLLVQQAKQYPPKVELLFFSLTSEVLLLFVKTAFVSTRVKTLGSVFRSSAQYATAAFAVCAYGENMGGSALMLDCHHHRHC